ncbi:chemotaxis response regulator protein-glutamate methylesterase of group 2 operon [Glycocaulis albus]|jgi:two-component system chemotaxis response regulator CheB|uniref:Protein-glutamate methylesterase/protein-glutamine glutaminase n=2 Tax=Glycocaulis albus TaxID=1382801 RepID=A0ABQ1XXE0_9PROT|nr:chemotaxis response regulator protein-glutamate methylesterase of group 2 operon [Glycocaulis albus]
MNTAANLPPGASPGTLPRVMVVDDSAVVRGLVARWVEADPRLALAATCSDGEQGVKRAGELQPDLVVLDIEMPRMDGLTALPLILKAAPKARVIMASTLTQKGAQVTLQALSLGAADFAPKPDTSRMGGAESYRVELLDKLAVLAPRYAPHRPVGAAVPSPAAKPADAGAAPAASGRELPARVDLLAIGSSTGGPQALRQVIQNIPSSIRMPVVIAQHMPKVFTAILAEHLSREGLPAHEASDGEALKPGHVYVAPGDYHMTIEGTPGQFRARLDQNPPINFCRPSVDPLFESCARAAGKHLLALVLTGMGSDGRNGARHVREAGGGVIVQDQASSVVWGMPGAVAEAGLADLVLPLNQIGPDLARRLTGAR